MTIQPDAGPRRLRAAIIGFGLDGSDDHQRLSTGDQCILVGGSAETHAEMLETMLRLESELERLGQGLADVTPDELAEIAWRIDSPELHEIALSLGEGLGAPRPDVPRVLRRGADRVLRRRRLSRPASGPSDARRRRPGPPKGPGRRPPLWPTSAESRPPARLVPEPRACNNRGVRRES